MRSGEWAPTWGRGRCYRDPHLREPARVLARAPKAPIGLPHAVGEQRGQGGPTWAILPPAALGLLPSKGGAPGRLGPTGSPSPSPPRPGPWRRGCTMLSPLLQITRPKEGTQRQQGMNTPYAQTGQ